ncbi:hypothetical protein GCM10022381_24690 [Leifsonia kafniensis]|uniref:Fibronectin type-III domain-containing protein n=1 Tax=Leifsonia kafniensis TaxID=475957 RepID=A0ABP7KMI3_9MICO
MTQRALDTTAPSVPTALAASATTSAGTTLTWVLSTDNVAVTGYEIYRNGALVTTIEAPATTYTDTGLTASTTYTYTVKARDAAGNVSAASTATSVTTTAPVTWYTVNNSSLCVDGDQGINVSNSTKVIAYGCKITGAANQQWQFVPSGTNFRVIARYAQTFAWSAGTASAPGVTLSNLTGNSQLWTRISLSNSRYQFKSVGTGNPGLCLSQPTSATGTSITQMTVQNCTNNPNASSTQSFTIGLVG